jgi:WD40 repeat protein
MGVLYGISTYGKSDLVLDGAYLMDNVRREWGDTTLNFGSQTFNIAILTWGFTVEDTDRWVDCSIYNPRDHLGLGKSGGGENTNAAALWFRKIVPPEHRLFLSNDTGIGIVELLPTTTAADIKRNYRDHAEELEDWDSVLESEYSEMASQSADTYPEKLEEIWQSNKGLYRTLTTKKAIPEEAVFSSDGTRILLCTKRRTELTDTFTGQVLFKLPDASRLQYATLSPDGKVLAVATYSENWQKTLVQLWDMGSGKLVWEYADFEWSISAIYFYPDSQHFITAHSEVVARLWHVVTGQPIHTFGELTRTAGGRIVGSAIKAIQLSSDGISLAIASRTGMVQLWDTHTRALRDTFSNLAAQQGSQDPTKNSGSGRFVTGAGFEMVKVLLFSPDGKNLLVSWRDGSNRLYAVENGQEIVSFGTAGTNATIEVATFSPDGAKVAIGLRDGRAKTALEQTWHVVQLWETAIGKLLHTFEGHQEGITTLAFSPDPTGTLLASGSYDGTVRVWNTETGGVQDIFELETDDEPIRSDISLWEVGHGKPQGRAAGHGSYISSAAFLPGGQELVTGSWDTTARVWNLTGSQPEEQLLYGEHQTFWSHDTWTGRGEIVTETQAIYNNPVLAVAVSPDGKWAASGSWDKTVRLWAVADGQTRQVWEGGDVVRSLAFSSDGRYLVAGCEDKTARLGNVQTGEAVGNFEGHSGYVTAVAFSASGKWLATGSANLEVRLWEVPTGRLVATFSPNETKSADEIGFEEGGWVRTLAFSADDEFLLSGGDNRVAYLWKMNELIDEGSPKFPVEMGKHRGIVNGAVFSPVLPGVVVTWDSQREVKVWQLQVETATSDIGSVELAKTYTSRQPIVAAIWQNRSDLLLAGAGWQPNLPYLYRLHLG